MKLHIHEKPKNEEERDFNRETKMLAESLRSKRQLDLQANPHGFISSRRRSGDFLDYFRKIIDSKQNYSRSALYALEAALRHLAEYTGEECKFSRIDVVFVEGFRNYLLTCEQNAVRPKSIRQARIRLAPNTAKSYFERFSMVVRRAYEDNYLTANPLAKVEKPKGSVPPREFLLIEELQKLAKTPCKMPLLRVCGQSEISAHGNYLLEKRETGSRPGFDKSYFPRCLRHLRETNSQNDDHR